MSYLGSTKQDKVVYIPVQDYKNIYMQCNTSPLLYCNICSLSYVANFGRLQKFRFNLIAKD